MQKPIVDIQMDKSTQSTSVSSSGVSNPRSRLLSSGDSPNTPLPTDPRKKAGPDQCFSGGMETGGNPLSPDSPVAIFWYWIEEGHFWGGSSTVAGLCVCCVLCIGRIAVAADLSFSYAEVSERQSPERKITGAKTVVELNLSERSGVKCCLFR